MADGPAYCEVTDLLVGNVPLPAYVDAQKFVDDAADEIDTHICQLYLTRVDVTDPTDTSRVAKLFLKRVNAHLASGRLLLSVAAPEEQKQLHAYAKSMVAESLLALEGVESGEYILEGAIPAEGLTEVPQSKALISNLDPESQVEAFYDRIANPDFVFTYADRYYRSPG